MESNKLTEAQLKGAFCEVRKAHRLIYEYQRRMQDLAWFIKNKLGFPDYKGFKKFSAPLNSRNAIDVENWSWDWIYTYVYEYHLGVLSANDNDSAWKLSIIQISDTGYYKNRGKGAVQIKPSTYAPVDDSDSKLLLYLSVATKKEKDFEWDTDNIIKQFTTEEHPVKIENSPKHIQIAYPISLSKFVDEDSTMKLLREFVEYCNKEAGTKLEIQE